MDANAREVLACFRLVMPFRPALTGLAAVAVSSLSQWALWSTDMVTGFINVAVCTSLVVTGSILAEDADQRRTARDMILAALFYLVSWWPNWPPEAHVGIFPLIGKIAGYLWFVFAALAILRYPESRLTRTAERLIPAALAIWIIGGKVLLTVVSLPAWHQYAGGTWWPDTFVDRATFDTATQVFNPVIAVLALGVVALLLAKLFRTRGMDRLDGVPVLTASIATGACGVTYLFIQFLAPGHSTLVTLRLVTAVAVLFISAGFLVTVLRRRLARAGVAQMVQDLHGRTSPEDVQAALRRVLQDSDVTIWSWNPQDERYVSPVDGPISGPPDDGRWHHALSTSDGANLALVSLDPRLRRHGAVVKSAIAAARQTLEIDRLHSDRLRVVTASREQIMRATLTERQRIERDLHDGAQQTLLAIGARLAAARAANGVQAADPALLAEAQEDVRRATRQLRELANGIYPPALTDYGLAAALPELAGRCRLPVQLKLSEQRFAQQAEITLYFVASEAMTNIAKHAGATSVEVALDVQQSEARLRVTDNGCGGASAGTGGSGLAGMSARVDAVGGELEVHSIAGQGTTITASIPCG